MHRDLFRYLSELQAVHQIRVDELNRFKEPEIRGKRPPHPVETGTSIAEHGIFSSLAAVEERLLEISCQGISLLEEAFAFKGDPAAKFSQPPGEHHVIVCFIENGEHCLKDV